MIERTKDMRLYLDTCIANDAFVLLQAQMREPLRLGDVKGPLDRWILEYVALYYLLDLDDQWDLEFGSSPVMRREIEQIQVRSSLLGQKRNSLLDMYSLLLEAARFNDLMPVPAHLLTAVRRILPDLPDVEHLCQTVVGGWDYFLTTDARSILANASALELLGIHAVSPRTFIEQNFLPLDVLVRALHGSWTTLDEVAQAWLADICQSVVLGENQ